MFGLVPLSVFALTGPMANAKSKVCVWFIDVFVCMCTHVCESKGGLCQQGSHLLCEHLKAVLIAAPTALWSVPVAYPANNISGVCACVLLLFPWVSLRGQI